MNDRAESHGHAYGFDLSLFEAVNVEESRWNTKGRNIILNIAKTNDEGSYWPRLTKDKVKNAHIQADWAKWVDEDEEDEAKPLGDEYNQENMNNFNMGGEGGYPGMGGMGGGDSDDDDEEEEEEADGGHVHGENCSHGHEGHGHEGHNHEGHNNEGHEHHEEKKNADLGDLDAEEEPAAQ